MANGVMCDVKCRTAMDEVSVSTVTASMTCWPPCPCPPIAAMDRIAASSSARALLPAVYTRASRLTSTVS